MCAQINESTEHAPKWHTFFLSGEGWVPMCTPCVFVVLTLGMSLLILCSFPLIRVGVIVIPYALSKGVLFSSNIAGQRRGSSFNENLCLAKLHKIIIFCLFWVVKGTIKNGSLKENIKQTNVERVRHSSN